MSYLRTVNYRFSLCWHIVVLVLDMDMDMFPYARKAFHRVTLLTIVLDKKDFVVLHRFVCFYCIYIF